MPHQTSERDAVVHRPIPREPGLDSSLALLREGYAFAPRRFARHRSDAFRTRLMLRNAVFVRGEDAARAFYEPGRMTRRRALPVTALTLLLDRRSVSMLDDEPHAWRKRMFLSLLAPDRVDELVEEFTQQWHARAQDWRRQHRVVLHDELREVLCRAVCAWAGIPLSPDEARRRTGEFGAMVDGAGSVGPDNWKAQLLRARTERWARRVVEEVRRERLVVDPARAVSVVALHRDEHGELLDVRTAAVELVNVLRPTVAVARFVVFAALALHQHPSWRARVADDRCLQWFAQEVRRTAPFFPAVGGRAREEFEWRGHRFPRGTWMLLDLFGTDNDPRLWDDPETFRPERFREWSGGAFTLVPQGGGDYEANHRCAGEPTTVALLERATRLLAELRYDVPPQDLTVDLGRMPALPASGFVMHVSPLDEVRADGRAATASSGSDRAGRPSVEAPPHPAEGGP